jgi:hypothetical protein
MRCSIKLVFYTKEVLQKSQTYATLILSSLILCYKTFCGNIFAVS